MQFLYVPLGDAQLPVVTLPSGSKVKFPLFEIACNPLIRVLDLQSGPTADVLVANAVRQAQEAIAFQLWSNVQELRRSNPDAEYLAVLCQVNPHAMAVSEPPSAIYDPPAEYDAETDSMIVPEGAVEVGKTEGYIGWYFTMTIGLGLLDELPEGMTPLDELPFYAVDPGLYELHVRDRLSTPHGQSALAVTLGNTLHLGNLPEDDYIHLTELADRHAARMQETT